MQKISWVLESEAFPQTHELFRCSILNAGHRLIDWTDDWLVYGSPSHIANEPTIFHGSLGNAAAVDADFNWSPGAFYNPENFFCSYWYELLAPWLIHENYEFTTVREFVENAEEISERVGNSKHIFVRPDSPLKPFSGRVVDCTQLSLKDLDFGFYYEDLNLPIVVGPLKTIGKEWRFVVVNHEVVTGSGYDPVGRSPIQINLEQAEAFANEIASSNFSPAPVYVLDLCEHNSELRLVELNPFGGADIYGCDTEKIVSSVSQVALEIAR